MSQPDWKLLWSTDDTAVFVDQTGTYDPEMVVAQEYETERGKTRFVVGRFSLEQYQIVADYFGKHDYLVPAKWDRSWPHPASDYEPWFANRLESVARSCGEDVSDLIDNLTSDDPNDLARAYQDLVGYFGLENFDSSPDSMSEDEFNEHVEKVWR